MRFKDTLNKANVVKKLEKTINGVNKDFKSIVDFSKKPGDNFYKINLAISYSKKEKMKLDKVIKKIGLAVIMWESPTRFIVAE